MWVVATIASLVALIVLVLCVPLDMVLRIDVPGRPKFKMRLAWLFGLISKEVRKGKEQPEEKKRIVEGKRKFRKRRIRARTIFEILRTKGLLKQLGVLLRNILRRLKFRELMVDCRVGLDNPADTGMLLAFIVPAILFLSSSFPYQMRVQPSFEDEAAFEGSFHGAIRLWPIQLVVSFIRFIFSLATVRVVKILILSKWKRRK